MSVFDELNGLASPVEVLITQIVSNYSGNQLVEVGAPVLADLQNDFVHSGRQENCRDQNTLTAASDFHRLTSKFHSRALKFCGEKSKFQFGDYMSVFFPE